MNDTKKYFFDSNRAYVETAISSPIVDSACSKFLIKGSGCVNYQITMVDFDLGCVDSENTKVTDDPIISNN